jgi:hypothetical protein
MRLFRIPTLLLLAALASASASSAQVLVSITVEPPVLPVYEQPAIPGPGYIWTPGYWAYGDDGYYWVPGTWVEPPAVGLLWTPGYWGWRDGFYAWNAGYWGPRVGYYGGINYGYGYVGTGYAGGYWNGGVFAYNRTVNNFGGVTIANTYSKTVIVNNTSKVSFNGGAGGTTAKPTPLELAAAKDPHTAATTMQTQHQTTASTNKELLASVNNGHPTVAATSKPGQFSGQGVVGAKALTSTNPTGNNAGGAAAKGATFNALSKQGTGTPGAAGLPKGTTTNLNTLSKQGTGTPGAGAGGPPKGTTTNFNTLSKQGTGAPGAGAAATSKVTNTGIGGAGGGAGAGGAGPKPTTFSAPTGARGPNMGVAKGSAGPAPQKPKGPNQH